MILFVTSLVIFQEETFVKWYRLAIAGMSIMPAGHDWFKIIMEPPVKRRETIFAIGSR